MKRTQTVNRISAWVLTASFLIYVLSGLDIQLRFLSPGLSSLIHLKYLFLIGQAAFIYHTSYSMVYAFKRRGWWKTAGKIVFFLYLAINIALVALFFSARN